MDTTSEQINLEIIEVPRKLPFEIPNYEWKTYLEKGITSLLVESNRLRQDIENVSLDSHDQKRDLLLHILEVMDAFERIIDHSDHKTDSEDRQFRSLFNNFISVYRMMASVLEEEGVRSIEFADGIATIGECKVVRTEKKDAYPDLTILDIVEKGYYWKDEILRKTSVVVAKH
jgi:molecular chaperone GrpE (heat shock protein)